MGKALKNTLTTIAVAKGFSDMIRTKYQDKKRNRTIMNILDRINKHSNTAFNYWKQADKDLIPFSRKKLTAIEKEFGDGLDVTIHTSFILAILDNLMLNLKNEKRKAIENLAKAVFALHKYFDKNLEKYTFYAAANRIATKWEGLS